MNLTPTIPHAPDELARGDFEMVVRRLADDLAFGADNSLFLGSGLEYASSRPYQPGDSVRSLNWRLTARTGKPFVKEFEALKRTSVYIVVDTSASMAVASTPIRKHDIAVWVAAAVGLASQRRLSPVAFVGGGDRATRLVPSLLASDLWQAIEPLRVGQLVESTRVGERLRQLNSRLDRASIIVVVSDLHDAGAIAAVRESAHRHDCVVLHTIDPAEVEPLRAGFFRGAESETGRTFLGASRTRWRNEHELARELARAGADYLALRTDRPFVPPLRHFLSSRAFVARGRG